MRCGKVERLLTPYLDERLEEGMRREVEAHLRGCPRCEEAHRTLRATRNALAAMGPAEPPPGLAQRALRTALAGRRAPAQSWLERLFPMAWRTAAVSATAAVALLVASNVTQHAAPSADVGDAVAEVTSTRAIGLDDQSLASLTLGGED